MTKEYGERKRAISLTNEDWLNLGMFLSLTHSYPEKELGFWREMEKEFEGNDKPKHDVAKDNIVFWESQIATIERIKALIYKG